MLLGVGGLAPLQVPNLKTPAPANERDLAFKIEFFAKVIRQDEAALLVGSAVLGLGVELPEKGAEFARGDAGRGLGCSADFLKFVRRHDEEELSVRLGDHEEFFARAIAPPTGRDGDAVFVIELMTKFSRVKS